MKARSGLKLALLGLTAAIGLSCAPAEFSKGTDPAPVNEFSCPGAAPDPTGCLTAKCRGGVSNPRVEITWTNETHCYSGTQNSNSLQKGDMHPDDPGRYWDWLWQSGAPPPPPGTVQHFTDTNVQPGVSYQYRAKYLAGVPSNDPTITIPLDACFCRD